MPAVQHETGEDPIAASRDPQDAVPARSARRAPAAPRRGRRHRTAGRKPGARKTMSALVAPSVILLILINLYPIVYAGSQAVHNGSLISSGPFVGFANFSTVFHTPAFWQAVEFTAAFTFVGVFGSWLIGLGIALLLHNLPHAGVFKVLLLLPWIVPIVVTSTSWNWLLATNTSPIPSLFHALGLGTPYFFANPTLAKITVGIFEVWANFPFMMLMSSAALTSVEESVYEAARMDGATPWKQFRLITLPLIARSTYISWILMTIFCVNDFPTIYLLTGGGPFGATTTLVVMAYQTVFHSFNTGPGVAIAFLVTIVLCLVAVFLYRRVRKAAAE
jgi:multiple sugar transport system permease protein